MGRGQYSINLAKAGIARRDPASPEDLNAQLVRAKSAAQERLESKLDRIANARRSVEYMIDDSRADDLLAPDEFGLAMCDELSMSTLIDQRPVSGVKFEYVLAESIRASGRSAVVTPDNHPGADVIYSDVEGITSYDEMMALPKKSRTAISCKSYNSKNYLKKIYGGSDHKMSAEIAHFCSCPVREYDPENRRSVNRMLKELLAHIVAHRENYDRIVTLCSTEDDFVNGDSDGIRTGDWAFSEEADNRALRYDLWDMPVAKVVDPIAELSPNDFQLSANGSSLWADVGVGDEYVTRLRIYPRKGRVLLQSVALGTCEWLMSFKTELPS